MVIFESQDDLLNFCGQAAKAPPMLIDQPLVDAFAKLTGDHQWIHTDPVRADKETAYGGTIAHALLTLSLIPRLYTETFEFRGRRLGLNYGFDRVRIPAPLRCGQHIHAEFRLFAAEWQHGGILSTWDVTVLAERAPRPVIAARWLTLNQYGA